MPGRLQTTADHGASLVEFALLVSLVALVALLAVQFAGNEASAMWSDIGSAVESAKS